MIRLRTGRQRPSRTTRRRQRRDQLGGKPRLADAGVAEDGDDAAGRSSTRWSTESSEAREARLPGRPEACRSAAPDRGAAGDDVVGATTTRLHLPFSWSGGIGSAVTASRTEPMVASPTRISPPPAEASSRCATMTASPVANACPCPGRLRRPRRCGARAHLDPSRSASSWSFRSARASRSSTAARTARSASSSCTTGIPKSGDDRVTDELLDRAAVPLEHLARGLRGSSTRHPESPRDRGVPQRRRSATSQKTSVRFPDDESAGESKAMPSPALPGQCRQDTETAGTG